MFAVLSNLQSLETTRQQVLGRVGAVKWACLLDRDVKATLPALQQSVPVTPSILDGRFTGEPASKAQYFKMGDDSLPSCLKTTDAQAACICKPHRDGKQAATVWGRGIVGVWEEGRHLLPEALQETAGRKRPAWHNRSQHQHSAELSCVLARAAMASVRAPLLLRQSHAESHLSEVTETWMCAYKVFLFLVSRGTWVQTVLGNPHISLGSLLGSQTFLGPRLLPLCPGHLKGTD